MNQQKILLGYWKIRGLGSRIRLLLEYTGVSYTEKFYTPENRDQWFNVEKSELAKKNSCITLPYIIDGEQLISESDACAIYVTHKSGKIQLLGRNAQEQVDLATVMGVFKDFYKIYLELIYGPQTKDFEELKPIYIEKFKPYLAKFNGLIEGKQYYAGQITYVDFFVADFIQHLAIMEPTIFENAFQNVSNHQKRIWDLPQIKSYIQSDRWIERPVNYVIGRWK